MLNIAICDDNVDFQKIFIRALKTCLKDVFSPTLRYRVLDGFTSSEQVLAYLKENAIDVLFLDIDLPKISGLELAKRLTWKNADTVIVFVSGYDRFVYEVFEFSPFAFLRKDHIAEELPKTIARISEKYEKKNSDVDLSTVDGTFRVCARDVLYIVSRGNYYVCCLKNGKEPSCRGTLSNAEKLFSPYDFFRVHSAHLVNLHQIQKIENGFAFVGPDLIKIPIAQRRLAAFKQAYAQFTMRDLHI